MAWHAETDPTFQWAKLVLDHAWLAFPLLAIGYLVLNPRILRNITSLKIGDFQVQLEAIRDDLKETKQQVAESHSNIEKLIRGIDINSPAADLHKASQGLKVQAAHLDAQGLELALAGLKPGADLTALYAAAVVARERRDPAVLELLIDCLGRIAASPKLGGVRLRTVWQLASAVHLTLVAIYQRDLEPVPDQAQLVRAQGVMERLIAHPLVLADRPDNPKQGIRGPAGHALRWIHIGLARAKP